MQQKILFIDRDGTIIIEPEDKQIDSYAKLQLVPNVIPALIQLSQAGFHLIMISNQDGLGTESFPEENFWLPHNLLMNILESQNIIFDGVYICPHLPNANCNCRKPKVGLLMNYLTEQKMDRDQSYVIGDRDTDLELAANLGIRGLRINQTDPNSWQNVADSILHANRTATLTRNTNETKINVSLNLDKTNPIQIDTGIGFFDHMLEQLSKHGGFSLIVNAKGDLHIDEHHTIEDVGLAIGQALRQALGDKRGIQRYGFLLPMDEALAEVALDLSGRPYFVFTGHFEREKVGELATELVPHFFRSLSDSLGANLHIKIQGENSHHMIEGMFKAVGRSLQQAIHKQGGELPSTKGIL